MFKKAQAAMEFLMTYGWAILVVLAAIGALAYFGVLSPGNLLPQKCEFSAGLDCTEPPAASEAGTYIEFPLTNSNGYKIHLDDAAYPAEVTDTDGFSGCTSGATTYNTLGSTDVPNGDNFIVRLNGCDVTEGERYSATVTITYRSNSTGMQHPVVGQITGKAGP